MKDRNQSPPETYNVDIIGKAVQNVGLRKTYHKILNDYNIDGVAINDPYKNTVNAYISADNKSRKNVYKKLKSYIKDKTGHKINIRERVANDRLQSVAFDRKTLEDTANSQYLAYMMRNKDVDFKNDKRTGLRKTEEDILPRFRLEKTKEGKYKGKLTQFGINQLKGTVPHYEKFRKHNLQSSLDHALDRMHSSDVRAIKQAIKRRGDIVND